MGTITAPVPMDHFTHITGIQNGIKVNNGTKDVVLKYK